MGPLCHSSTAVAQIGVDRLGPAQSDDSHRPKPTDANHETREETASHETVNNLITKGEIRRPRSARPDTATHRRIGTPPGPLMRSTTPARKLAPMRCASADQAPA